MSGKEISLGPVGVNITHTVRRIRETRHFSYAELSRRLADLGREIPPLGLRRIEAGTRRVDVDDLAALALALNVSPLTLLLPREGSPLTPQSDWFPAEVIQQWGRGETQLSGDFFDYLRESNPEGFAALLATVPANYKEAKRSTDGDDQ